MQGTARKDAESCRRVFTQRRKGRKASDPERKVLTTLRRSEAVQGTARFAGDTERTEVKNRKRSDQIEFDRTVCLVEKEEKISERFFTQRHQTHKV
jgi:hypothetical protein